MRLSPFPVWVLVASMVVTHAPLATRAEEPSGLYEGEVAVASKSEEDRDAALAAALRQVLAKLTGQREPRAAGVDQALADAGRYLRQFRYRGGADEGAPLTLWARFDAAEVDALVRDAGLPVWARQRPVLLAWVALREGGQAEIVGPDSATGLAQSMQTAAWQRGLPLRFPLLDLDDRIRIQAIDIWRMDEDKIRAASQRYGAGPMLLGRLERGPDPDWNARWSLWQAGAAASWTGRGADAGVLGAQAVEAAADRIAARYAIAADVGTGGGLELRVAGVRSIADYARTQAYLHGLDQIAGLRLRGARADELAFRAEIRGGGETLRRLVSFGDVLTVDGRGTSGDVVRMRLLP